MTSLTPPTIYSASYSEIEARQDLKCVSSACSICLEDLSELESVEPLEYRFLPPPKEERSRENRLFYHVATQAKEDSEGKAEKAEVIHAYHEGCLRRWFQQKRTCPLCTENLESSEIPRKPMNWRYQFELLFQEMHQEFAEKADTLQVISSQCVRSAKRVGNMMTAVGNALNRSLSPFVNRLLAQVHI